MKLLNCTYTKEDNTVSKRRLLVAKPVTNVDAIDVSENTELEIQQLTDLSLAYDKERKEAFPSFDKWLENKNISLRPKYKTFKLSGLKVNS